MAGIKDISSVWKNIKEIDLKPIRDSATYAVRIVLVGEQGSGRHTLAEQMRTDPARPEVHTQSPITFLSPATITETPVAHLIIVIVDASRADSSTEQSLVKGWNEAGKNVLVFINKIDRDGDKIINEPQAGWPTSRVLFGSVNDPAYLQREFIPVVLDLLPQQHLALGRQFPLFRLPIARQLISDTCFSNAAYSLSTGLAEIVPVLDLPLNVTDMIVLTKSQAFLAYKLGLLVGFSTHWQDYVSEFGSVIGGAFLWRQIARQLVGLIPAWGIIPKVAIAYSGTYVVGNAILGWYLTGKNLSPKQLRDLSVQSFARGKEFARKQLEKIPRPRLGKRAPAKALDAPKKGELVTGEIVISTDNRQVQEETVPGVTVVLSEAARKQLKAEQEAANRAQTASVRRQRQETRRHSLWQKKQLATEAGIVRTCIKCGKTSSSDAMYCQYCGNPFES